MTEPIKNSTELILLRTFYGFWTELHSIPRDRLHRRKQEQAAQDMVDAHNALVHFYSMNKPAHIQPLIVPAANEAEANAPA